MSQVLIIDDDRLFSETLEKVVTRAGHQATSVHSLQEGLESVNGGGVDLVFLDVRMPEGSGLELLPKIRKVSHAPEVVIITGFGDPDGAELAIKNGAWDYIEKAASSKKTILAVKRALEFRQSRADRAPFAMALKRDRIIGHSPALTVCFEKLAQAANSEASVLIGGETGTGKEIFAAAIHENSSRAGKPFVVVDCAALPETLAGSVLFGHEKGAFTGADRARTGLISQADGGTLFLDEVGELSPALQKNFLRVLETQRFRPLGGRREQQSNFRLVAASNRNLETLIDGAHFRQDLLFRLRGLVIDLPPLRERLEDLKELARHYVGRICDRNGAPGKGISPQFLATLAAYPWPGNVRELIQTLEITYATAVEDAVLQPWHLPIPIRIHMARASVGQGNSCRQVAREGAAAPSAIITWRQFKETQENGYLQNLLAITGGNILKASKTSGLSRPRLYELLRKHGLQQAK